MLKINGVTVKSPSKLIVTENEVSKSERNAAGKLVVDRIGRKRGLHIQWNYLTKTEMQLIAQNAGSDSAFFAVETFNPQTGAMESKEMTLQLLETGVARLVNGALAGWEGTKLDVMER